MTPKQESPLSTGDRGGLSILYPDGIELRSGVYRDDALHAADDELRDAALDLEWAQAAHLALIRDGDRADADDDLALLEARCTVLECEARLGRAHVALRRLRRGGE